MLGRWDSEAPAIDSGNRLKYAYFKKLSTPAPASCDPKSIESGNRFEVCILQIAVHFMGGGVSRSCGPKSIELGNRLNDAS